MKTLYLAFLSALALAGCGDSKQQKLEECMDSAARKFDYVSTYAASKIEGSVCNPADASMSILCRQTRDLAKQQRLEEEEDRCVKLYK